MKQTNAALTSNQVVEPVSISPARCGATVEAASAVTAGVSGLASAEAAGAVVSAAGS